ncbi:hypothetical protein GIX77_10385 [Lactobacillus reuteri]|uniref:Uncharacterized protein n=1 Tax=Limosilactobacillus reuteri TaxID=1598 RepID=A0A7X2KJX1_LIMRT|nr:hypothetical protein [Limosilactobacillus reuteri]MRH72976.1 hypothetical protein [Limosilactobacillus reuteri]MRH81139.1 hypothetical protein [Limosilactobacillus reuteri]
MNAAAKTKKTQTRVQTNIDLKIKNRAENVIKEAGLISTAVINELYTVMKKIENKSILN